MPVFVDGEGLNISSLNEKVLDLEGKIPLMEERIRDLENQLNSSENFFYLREWLKFYESCRRVNTKDNLLRFK